MRFEETLGISHILKTTEHEMRQKMDAALLPLKLTYPQYSTLSALESADVATNAELARQCQVTAQTMNRITQNLEKDGFMQRRPDPAHGLKVVFRLTAKGRKTICSAHVAVNEIELTMVKGLDKSAVQALQRALEHCAKNLSSCPKK